MNWNNIKTIFFRELKDQLRDRRTIVGIALLPLILYPLMGMAMLQVAQFSREQSSRIAVVGVESGSEYSNLFSEGKLSKKYCPPELESLIEIVPLSLTEQQLASIKYPAQPKRSVNSGAGPDDDEPARLMNNAQIDALLLVRADNDQLVLFSKSVSGQSQIAASRLNQILSNWRGDLVGKNLADRGIPESVIEPFSLQLQDVSPKKVRSVAAWSKILPFVLLVWALTGAFYPAIDLCAGEKERGTLETLLCSPAKRSEIVAGKLLTVMTFSVSTSVLNLVSMGFTGLFVIAQFSKNDANPFVGFGPPPIGSMFWLILGLLPIAALFSALSLGVAAFARSSKEGQYYLMPLMMISLPLMMLSTLPSTQLDLGTSLIPITGMMLLLRNMMEGDMASVVQYLGPVLAVTIACCWMSVRWTIQQFNNEAVLFPSSERFGVGDWIRHLMRGRGSVPTWGQAILCGMMILMIKFYVSLAGRMPETFGALTKQIIVIQVATIAVPAILMAVVLTSHPLRALRINRPRWIVVPTVILAAIMIHPAIMMLSSWVLYVYPPNAGLEQMQFAIGELTAGAPGILAIVLLFAVVPAICEEITFRGFVLTGLETLRRPWTAIIASSLLFGVAHGILQQSIVAFVTGMILGVIAVRTQSLIPCILYHATHNSLSILLPEIEPANIENLPILAVLFECGNSAGGQTMIHYTPWATLLMTVIGVALIVRIWQWGPRNKNVAGS